MKWENRGQSRNVTDNRGRGGRSVGGLGGLGSLGIGGFLILLVLSLVFGVDLFGMLGIQSPLGGGSTTQSAPQGPGAQAGDEERVGFVSAILDDNQTMWAGFFEESNIPYEEATLSLESGTVPSACGNVPEAAGPFYCPLDSTIYLNFAFYDQLTNRFGASGDFAQAYVISHEVGHHIQNLLGTAADVRQQQQANPSEANRLSVALELQADCYAGVWGADQTSSRVSTITREDFREAMNAAAAIGDDNIQRQTTGRVDPEGFTHGSSEQRTNWFSRGFESGDPNSCDTFAGS